MVIVVIAVIILIPFIYKQEWKHSAQEQQKYKIFQQERKKIFEQDYTPQVNDDYYRKEMDTQNDEDDKKIRSFDDANLSNNNLNQIEKQFEQPDEHA